MNASFYTSKENGLECLLCPHKCLIINKNTGLCGIRCNNDNILKLPYFGKISSIAIDPIEKKPLYHFFPTSKILSIGFIGCNLHCPFCQNYAISQYFNRGTIFIKANDVIAIAVEKKCKLIAFTYSEPVIHFEYVLDVAKKAKIAGLITVLVTNGYLNIDPAKKLLPYIDAINVDLKSFNEKFYEKELGGTLDPVLHFLKESYKHSHLEITTLIIPNKNDSSDEIDKLVSFIASIDQNIPLHLSCYFPRYKYTIRSTRIEDLEPLIKIAKSKLNFVYSGNIELQNNTICPKCGNLLILRNGYNSFIQGLINKSCSKCGFPIPVKM